MKPEHAKIVLEDGTVFEGKGFGHRGSAAGEVVFNTGMVGYPEALTDPSYRGQILVLTYPLIGNYGVPAQQPDEFGLPHGFESDQIQVAGLVVTEQSIVFSHHQGTRSLDVWLTSEKIPAIAGIDTRALTKRLRSKGTMLGKIERAGEEIGFFDPNATDLISSVSVSQVMRYEVPQSNGRRSPVVVVLDCGCKISILRSLLTRGFSVIRVPHDYYFLNIDFDGLVISSGPGDPKYCTHAIRHIEHALAVGKPILGICLGHQILALAAGADTYKLKFGHRSQNQPSLELEADNHDPALYGGRCHITSQNHGFAVRKERLPTDWQTWFLNANDQTVEGIKHTTKPFYGVQFHPEANPGPVDTAWIFDEFAEQVRRRII